MNPRITLANYSNTQHAKDIVNLLSAYAIDQMGGGGELDDYTKTNLVAELARLPNAFSILCYVDSTPVGLVNCFEGFSTFMCKPLINIHDVVVISEFRGLGISQLMLARVQEIAQAKGCCKMTLEVLEGNEPARRAYAHFGFAGYELDPEMGKALFWQKRI